MVRAGRDFRISLNAVVDGVRRTADKEQMHNLQHLIDTCTHSIEVNYDMMRKVRIHQHAVQQAEALRSREDGVVGSIPSPADTSGTPQVPTSSAEQHIDTLGKKVPREDSWTKKSLSC